MKLLDAIVRANALRPNDIAEEIKADWISRLEVDVAELMFVEHPQNVWPNDQELLMPAPYDDIYELYLCAMIDNANQDTALYSNDMEMFNEAKRRAFSWWRRNHTPPRKGNWRVM